MEYECSPLKNEVCEMKYSNCPYNLCIEPFYPYERNFWGISAGNIT